LCKEI